MGSPSAVGNLSQASPEQRVPAGNFAEPGPGSSSFQNNRANRLTFDFLPEGDNTVPGINTDSDFIDSLLKSGSGNDDWMKDINLDEILGSHSWIAKKENKLTCSSNVRSYGCKIWGGGAYHF